MEKYGQILALELLKFEAYSRFICYQYCNCYLGLDGINAYFKFKHSIQSKDSLVLQ